MKKVKELTHGAFISKSNNGWFFLMTVATTCGHWRVKTSRSVDACEAHFNGLIEKGIIA